MKWPDAIATLGQCAVIIVIILCVAQCSIQMNANSHAEEMAKIAAVRK